MPTTRSAALLSLACLGAFLGGCRTPGDGLAIEAERPALLPADFVLPAHLARGFDYVARDADWRAGDAVLFGLRLRRGEHLRRWLVELQVLEPVAVDDDGASVPPLEWTIRMNGAPQRFTSAATRVRVAVMDERGELLGESTPLVPRDYLTRGLATACRSVRRLSTDRGEVQPVLDEQQLADGVVAAVALLQVVQNDRVLQPLLWEVIERPSLWSVVKNLGAAAVLRPRFLEMDDVPSPVPQAGDRAWRLPMGLFVNEAAALQLELFVAEPQPPFHLPGGIVGAVARHPGDPDAEFSLLLLSARRGAARYVRPAR